MTFSFFTPTFITHRGCVEKSQVLRTTILFEVYGVSFYFNFPGPKILVLQNKNWKEYTL